MALDSSDFRLVQGILSAAEESSRTLEKVALAQTEIQHISAQTLENSKQLVTAFNRMATAIEGLTKEVAALRKDMAPELGKTTKLHLPQKLL